MHTAPQDSLARGITSEESLAENHWQGITGEDSLPGRPYRRARGSTDGVLPANHKLAACFYWVYPGAMSGV